MLCGKSVKFLTRDLLSILNHQMICMLSNLNLCVKVWCCVDKEGILSLPNPCAEKVFFLKSRKCKLKEELVGRTKERKESVSTWTSEASKISSSQDGQESSDDDDEEEAEDDDDDDEVCASDLDSAGKVEMQYIVHWTSHCHFLFILKVTP